ncbi:MAG: hypothetical protein PHW10_00830 [Candidatus Peribacteraceae bacterium]|nr:hypothetical protein [Candidatus Peribacteraceae bacterium]
MRTRSPTVPLLLTLLLLAGCSADRETAQTPETTDSQQASASSAPSRPTAPLGLYVGYYMGGGGIPTNRSALQGVDAYLKILTYDPLRADDTFALLQELGNVLQINVPELLNRSDDRPTTLTEYSNALGNITERSRRTAQDLQATVTAKKKEDTDRRKAVAALQKRIDQAFGAGDFATAGALQKDLTQEQTGLTALQSEIRQAEETRSAFAALIDIADRRLTAIEENRQILIAGLQVVDLPGIDPLGIIRRSSQRGGLLGF